MRLKQIKLMGFKSFVDPTVLHLNAQLIGIVGPNGCGKSNIIDAVRWVLGESSAKDLRGESMVDVIFNGSTSRKPVGLAAIELLFDNLEGKLDREYANFSEVSIRREIDRNRQSEYYLNDKKCRKRDITDLFAGTGLLQNGYAIIGQGTVSKIIESKPEELRGFVEEAADIAIYKKRRHETELRMQHTEENLTRLQDLIIEQDRLLEKLDKQQTAAKKYQQYQTEKQVCELKLLSIKAFQLNQQVVSYEKDIRQISLELEQHLSKKSNISLQLEQYKIKQTQIFDDFSNIQEEYYTLNTSVAKLEQTLHYKKEQHNKCQNELSALNLEITKISNEYNQDQHLQDNLTKELLIINKKHHELEQGKCDVEKKCTNAQLNMQEWHTSFNALHMKFLDAHNKTEKTKYSIEQIENLSKELCLRIEKLNQENITYDQDELNTQILLLEKDLRQQEKIQKINQEQLTESLEVLKTHKETIRNLLEQKNQLQSNNHKLLGKIGAIKSLQHDSLEINTAKYAWLDKVKISSEPLFFQQLNIEEGWEIAVGVALSRYLDAILLKNYNDISIDLLCEVKDFKLTLIEAVNINLAESSDHLIDGDKISIISKINNNCEIACLLKNIYVVEDLDVALQQRKHLLPEQYFITRSGEVVGLNWILIDQLDPKKQILLRNKELQHLDLKLQQLSHELSNVDSQTNIAEQALADVEQKRAFIESSSKEEENKIRILIASISSKKTKLDNIKHRSLKIVAEIKEYQSKLQELSAKEISLRKELEVTIDDSAYYNEQKNLLLTQKSELQTILEQNLQNNKLAISNFHEIALKQQSIDQQINSISSAKQRVLNQLQNLQEKQLKLQQEIQNNNSPLKPLELELEALLDDRLIKEQNLQIVKNKLEEVEEIIKNLEQDLSGLELTIEQYRAKVEQLKLDHNRSFTKLSDIMENVEKSNLILDQNIDLLNDGSIDTWQSTLDKIIKNLEKLGAVNLAAIEEFNIETERKKYLNSQQADLTTALATLKEAILKIDTETRKKFKATFEQINNNFQKLFPKLFGGGSAHLELDTDDWLVAGVSVLAQPPGKKNSSIYLLSGGEKALTAVSLIFAIFQLNPAPFCILDEVDAPLDDANVNRFSELLIDLSTQVQFIFITHNKTTMKIANQLTGVTMKEPGVSRLVSVNIDEAVEMVN